MTQRKRTIVQTYWTCDWCGQEMPNLATATKLVGKATGRKRGSFTFDLCESCTGHIEQVSAPDVPAAPKKAEAAAATITPINRRRTATTHPCERCEKEVEKAPGVPGRYHKLCESCRYEDVMMANRLADIR